MRIYLGQILHLLGNDKRKLPLLIILFLGASMLDLAGLGLIGPYVSLVVDPGSLDGVIGGAVDFFGLPHDQEPLLFILGVTLFVIFLLKTASSIGIRWIIIRFSMRQQLRLKSHLMQTYQGLPYTEYLRRNSSEYIYNIHTLTTQFANMILHLLRSISDGIVGLVIFVFLAWTNGPALALLVVLLLAMVICYDKFFGKNLKRYGLTINRATTQMVQGIREGIEGLKEIRVLGHEKHFLRKVQNGAKEVTYYQTLQQVISMAPRYLLELMMVAFIVLLVLGTQKFGQDLNVLLPTLGVFSVAALRLLPMTNTLSGSLVKLRFFRDAVSKIYRDFEQLKQFPIEIIDDNKYNSDDLTSTMLKEEPFRKLELDNLTFRYPNATQDALSGISLKIQTGDAVGFIGPSGAGKTTMVDLLLGLLKPQSGEMRYNDKPLIEAMEGWRAQAAYLPQDVFLIDNTLRSNVALGIGNKDIDNLRLNEALRKARLNKLVEQLPDGVETLLGERGVRLSGGQRQRVALARAFFHDRSVLVMDEATSALDDKTEQDIVDEILHLKGHITMIVIAHRLTTVKHCDRIYKLNEGQIVDEGSFDSVVNKSSGVN